MKNELAVIKTVTTVCDFANTIITTLRQTGYVNRTEKEEMLIKINAAKKACASTQINNLFLHNLDCLEKATNHMNAKNFQGKALAAVEEEYDILIMALKRNLEDYSDYTQTIL